MSETETPDGIEARLRDLGLSLIEFEHVVAQRIAVKGRNQCGLFGSNDCLTHLSRVRDRAGAVAELAQQPQVAADRWRSAAIIGWLLAVAGFAGLAIR